MYFKFFLNTCTHTLLISNLITNLILIRRYSGKFAEKMDSLLLRRLIDQSKWFGLDLLFKSATESKHYT